MQMTSKHVGRLILLISSSLLAGNDEMPISSHETAESTETVHRSTSETKQQTGYYTLKHPLIAKMDGVPFMLDWKAMRDMFKVRQKVNEHIQGKLDSETKQRIGIVSYQGTHYTLVQLAHLEREGQRSQEEINQLLMLAKKEFMDTVYPFMAKMNRTKALVLELMKESCRVRNIPDSFLLSWTKANGNERDIFYAGIKSFGAFERFCKELNNFLGDLIHSCPRALNDYKQRVAAGTHLQQ